MKEINEIEDDSHEVQIIARLSTGILISTSDVIIPLRRVSAAKPQNILEKAGESDTQPHNLRPGVTTSFPKRELYILKAEEFAWIWCITPWVMTNYIF